MKKNLILLLPNNITKTVLFVWFPLKSGYILIIRSSKKPVSFKKIGETLQKYGLKIVYFGLFILDLVLFFLTIQEKIAFPPISVFLFIFSHITLLFPYIKKVKLPGGFELETTFSEKDPKN